MSRWNVSNLRLQGKAPLAAAATVLIALGAGGGAAAVSMTRPTVTMAPTTPTPIAKLASTGGIVTAKGRVAEVFGDRFVVQDATGRAMVASNRDAMPAVGSNVMVQGRYDDGVMHAQYLVNPQGTVTPVGPPPPPPGGCAPGGPGGPGMMPPPPPPANGAAPQGAPVAPPPPPAGAPAPAPMGAVRPVR
ncbi:MAG: hypothetical protein ACK4TC_10005 [Sphingomonas pseudosanguinis]|uniref:hypothetical protein n=1 Tax=Sphingomonas pseudosanguinis TaxID=413712 RepID=UPI0039198596